MKDNFIQIKVTAEEKAKIEEKAKEQGLNVSAYLRMLGLKGEDK